MRTPRKPDEVLKTLGPVHLREEIIAQLVERARERGVQVGILLRAVVIPEWLAMEEKKVAKLEAAGIRIRTELGEALLD